MTVFEDVTKEDIERLLKKGYSIETPKTIHEDFRLRKGTVSLVYYTSGKLLLQGKDADDVAEELKSLGFKEVKKITFRKESGWFIGSDETLKGDTFGGLVVAAVKADETIREQLKEAGAADSKTLRDAEILPLAEKIRRIAPCEVISLLPEEYNRFSGVTEILNKLHADSRKDLGPGKHVVDKYPGCSVGDIIEEKADSKYVEVAAASILARAAGLKQLQYLSQEAGFEIPKGSTHVKEALQMLKEKKLEPRRFVKLHFRNVQEFLCD
ncbi:hypothetical protein COV20_01950 [Candidatus Woesearchaeota archaeon CG10_big_fil_rev_8_21_14_0_10_45_16]|nr:MAG: hypothetical protein COV20_01950 [Candidatus Woesearchaeota archaeon CG10_big_fil_rev_8_21_14_0_10_45_16]